MAATRSVAPKPLAGQTRRHLANDDVLTAALVQTSFRLWFCTASLPAPPWGKGAGSVGTLTDAYYFNKGLCHGRTTFGRDDSPEVTRDC